MGHKSIEDVALGDNSTAEIIITRQSAIQTANAIDACHQAIGEALNRSAGLLPKDPRPQARLQVHLLLENAIQPDALLGFDTASMTEHDIESFFMQQFTNLKQFYAYTEEGVALKKEDEDFFNFVISLFKSLAVTYFNLNLLAKHLEKFTITYRDKTLAALKSSDQRLAQLHLRIEQLHEADAAIDQRCTQLRKLESTLYASLHDPDFQGSYADNHAYITHQYHELSRLLNKLDHQAIALSNRRTEIKNNLKNLDYIEAEKQVVDYNLDVNTLASTLKRYKDARARLATHANTLYNEIKGQIQIYHDAGTALEDAIFARNRQYASYHSQLQKVGENLKESTLAIAKANIIRDKISATIAAIQCVESSSPQAICEKLKLKQFFSGRHDSIWDELGKTIISHLQVLGEPLELDCIDTLTTVINQTKQTGKLALDELRKYNVLNHEPTSTQQANELIDRNDKLLENLNAEVSTRIKNLRLPRIFTYQRVLVRPGQECDDSSLAKSQGKSNKGFFARHWKAILGGLLFGAGVMAAATLTSGMLPLLGTAIGIAAITGSGALGTILCCAGCWLYDYRHSRYQISIKGDEPDSPPSTTAHSPDCSDQFQHLVFRRAAHPVAAPEANQTGDVNLGTYHCTSRLFANHRQIETSHLYPNKFGLKEELAGMIKWLKRTGATMHRQDIGKLESLKQTLDQGQSVLIEQDPRALRYLALKDAYLSGKHAQTGGRPRSNTMPNYLK